MVSISWEKNVLNQIWRKLLLNVMQLDLYVLTLNSLKDTEKSGYLFWWW
jgi:hypothetical protein